MLRATQFAAAFAAASANTPKTHNNWVARKVDQMVNDPNNKIGIVREPDVQAHVCKKTNQHIATSCQVRV